MKRLLSTLATLLIVFILSAQAPQAFKYQTVVRGSAGEILPNQYIGLQISIREGSSTGTIVYQERHYVTTNQFGLANLDIGTETPLIGTFPSIDWRLGLKFLEVELDPTGSSVFTSMGTTQLLSVPFALHAETSSQDGDWTISGNDLFTTLPGNVGIGTSAPNAPLDIRGNNTDDGAWMQIGNSDESHRLGFYGGRENDPNPYIFWSETDPLRFATNLNGWTEHMRISSDGKVGIGTTNPQAELEINTDVDDGNIIRLDNPSGGPNAGSAIYFYENGLYKAYLAYANSGNYGNLSGPGSLTLQNGDGPIQIRTGFEEPLILAPSNNGNVGIGTDNPTEKLTVNGGDTRIVGSDGWAATGHKAKLYLGDPNHGIMASHSEGLRLYTYNNPSHDIRFRDHIGTDYMTIKMGTGNVGIGTINPLSKLEVNGTVTANNYFGDGSGLTGISGDNLGNHTATQNLAMSNYSLKGLTTDNCVHINLSGEISFTELTESEGLKVDGAVRTVGCYLDNGTGDYWLMFDDPSDRFTIYNPNAIDPFVIESTTGNVGIGTLYPLGKLSSYSDTDLYSGYFESGFADNNTHVVHAEFIGGLADVSAVYGKSVPADYYGIGGNFLGGYIGIASYVTPTGSFEYYGITNTISGGSGVNFGIYSYAYGSGTNYAFYGESSGSVNSWAGYFNGDVTVNGTFTNPSDEKLKTNVQPFTDALSKVNQLNIQSFDFKSYGDAGHFNLPEKRQVGFIAQEMEKVFPDLVSNQIHSYHKNNSNNEIKKDVQTIHFKGINYIGMIPVLTQAIKEQQEIIEELQKRIEVLEQR